MKKNLFLHIPKTAGSSLLSSEVGNKIDYRIHSFIGCISEQINKLNAQDSFKFCITRNPWDRFFSLYQYFYNMREDHMFYKYNPSIIKVVRRYDTFEKFCCAFPELEIKNFHFYPQSKYIFLDDLIIPDYIGKIETISEDINELAEMMNVKLTREFPHSNKSNQLNYRTQYNQKTKNMIAEVYKMDVERLGYDF